MELRDIMSKKIIFSEYNDSIFDISNLMKQNNIGFIPVKKDNELIGVITDRDIIIKAISNNCDIDDTIFCYITKNIVKIDISSSIEEALKLMSNHQVKRLIVTKNENPVGIVSISDILNNYDNNIIEYLKQIWKLKDNKKQKDSEIDDFYL